MVGEWLLTSPGSALMDDTLKELQYEYGASCSRYERKVSSKLANSDTIIVSGYGCALRVKNDALVIVPGKTHKDQTQETTLLYRGVHNINHIVLLSDKGVVTLDAVKWANEQGIAIMMLDGHGNLMLSLSTENEADAALRHAQYHARDSGLDVSIARELVKRKTESQIEVLKSLPNHPIVEGRTIILQGQKVTLQPKGVMIYGDFIWKQHEDGLTELSNAGGINDIRLIEARLAMSYWGHIVGIPIHWKTSDRKKVPPHWKRCTERISSLSGSRTAQRANNPYQAVTNYAYAILQGQCKQSLVSQGFDTTCGFLHADQLHRDSLVFDIMECHRARVDQVILHMFASHTLSKGEFMSTTDGSVQFNPQFSRYIAASCRIPQEEVEDSVLWLKALLLGF